MRPQRMGLSALFFASVLGLGCAAASPVWAGNPVPAELPKPDGKPGSTDKPVKIYIFSGQSNSVGFGRVEGGDVHYHSILLSADPSVQPCSLTIGPFALLPMRVYQNATGDEQGAKAWVFKGSVSPDTDPSKHSEKPAVETTVALGTVSQDLPRIDGLHTVVVKGFIEVPMTGMHEVYAGFEESSYAVASVNGTEVYRKAEGGQATLTKIKLEAGKRHPITIHYSKGGKASLWLRVVDLKPRGNMEYYVKEHGRYTCLVDDEGKWNVRQDVIVCDAYLGNGGSQPLGAMWRRGTFGPELGAGYVLGTYHDEPVIVMKADIGNRSLAWDILPPGSERYTVDGRIYAGYKDTESSWPVEQGQPKPGGWYAGKQYDDYTASIKAVLDNFGEKFPQFKDQGYEIAGFVWWQGHKDQNPVHAARYEQNMVNLINAWRKEFNAPNAKWAIATIGFEGWRLAEPGKTIAEAQLAVSGDSGRHPEFKGNVKTIEARDLWREPGESPKNQGYHYNHNAETYFLVGDALGRAIVEMHGGKAEKQVLPQRVKDPETWPENPTLQEAARMIYSNAFLSPWVQDPAEPTAEEMHAIAPILKPFIADRLIPDFVYAADKVPSHLRRGTPLSAIVTNQNPGPKGISRGGFTGQIDTLIGFYNTIGVHDYNWRVLQPDLRQATWHYYSFNPKEPFDPKTNHQYREITYPPGMENWYAVDFDPVKAGWKTGQAPFGQNNGKLEAVRNSCSNPQCRCHEKPNTLWEHDVLLMRQTFELPSLREDRRYRLIVGGGSHAWAGEGYMVYVNGKPFIEVKEGFYKGGGERGGIIYNDFMPEFKTGKVTIAVKAFLRRSGHLGVSAPPTGHLSLWLEEVWLPPIVTQAPPTH